MGLSGKMMGVLRSVRARKGAAVFLTYHRVGNFKTDVNHLSLPTSLFEEHVVTLGSRYTLLTVGEVFSRILARKSLPRNAAVITFDDGYSDMYSTIRPILQKYQAPATFFVTSGIIDMTGEDIIDASYENRADVPYANAQKNALAANEKAQPHGDPDEMGIGLTARQVCEINDDDLFEIGAHGASHINLATLTPELVELEISQCTNRIAEIIGERPLSFSYPYGARSSYNSTVFAALARHEYRGACTTHLGSVLPWGAAYPDTNTFITPRIATNSQSLDDLIARIDQSLALR